MAERALVDGPFRDQTWDLLLKIETAYETKEGMIQMLEKRIGTIPHDYNYKHLIAERDEARGPEEEIEENEDPVMSITPFSAYTFRRVTPRVAPSPPPQR